MDLSTRILKIDNYPVVELDGEKALLNTDTGRYIVLNEVAGAIWDMLDSYEYVSELLTALNNTYRVEEEVCKLETIGFLEKIEDAKLVRLCSA